MNRNKLELITENCKKTAQQPTQKMLWNEWTVLYYDIENQKKMKRLRRKSMEAAERPKISNSFVNTSKFIQESK